MSGYVNPKYLCGKTIYNWWESKGFIVLILKDTHETLWMKADEPMRIKLEREHGVNPFTGGARPQIDYTNY